jgi:hypothetical protein
MAVDGIYKVKMQTPMGEQRSTWTLKVDGGSLSGVSESPVMGRAEFSGGSVNGDEFSFALTANTPMGPTKIDFKGIVQGDQIAGNAMTPFGQAPFTGSRA